MQNEIKWLISIITSKKIASSWIWDVPPHPDHNVTLAEGRKSLCTRHSIQPTMHLVNSEYLPSQYMLRQPGHLLDRFQLYIETRLNFPYTPKSLPLTSIYFYKTAANTKSTDDITVTAELWIWSCHRGNRDQIQHTKGFIKFGKFWSLLKSIDRPTSAQSLKPKSPWETSAWF